MSLHKLRCNAYILHMGMFLFLVAAILGYLFPSIVARLRRHQNTNPILIVNLLLGWTVLGWIACLAWSASSNTQPRTAGSAPSNPST
jgi:predicted PurR-regulated permease PerM